MGIFSLTEKEKNLNRLKDASSQPSFPSPGLQKQLTKNPRMKFQKPRAVMEVECLSKS